MPDPDKMDVTDERLGLLGLAHDDGVPYQLKGEIRFAARLFQDAVATDESMRQLGAVIGDEMRRTWSRDLVEYRGRLRQTVRAMGTGDPMVRVFLSIPTRAPNVAPTPTLTERLRDLLDLEHNQVTGEFGDCEGAPECSTCQAIADASPKGVA